MFLCESANCGFHILDHYTKRGHKISNELHTTYQIKQAQATGLEAFFFLGSLKKTSITSFVWLID